MSAIKFSSLSPTIIREGVERRLAHTDHLMMTIFDFNDGPKAQPDPPHSHPHEQVSYVVDGEIFFFIGDEQPVRLGPGDVFTVPSGVPHSIQLLTQHVRLVDAFTPLREDFLK
jgi:quercetin dioxygenase-like cupin family protein